VRLHRRSSATLVAAVASAAALVAGTGGGVALATSAGAAETAALAAPPVAQVPDNHGIADLIALVDQLRADDDIPAHVHAQLIDRLQRALAQEQGGSEVRTIGLLQQFVAKARNQVKGDAEDAQTRDLLIERAEAIIGWLQFDDDAETSGSAALQEAVTLEGVMRHLRAFQDIAAANGYNRFAGLPGYDRSAEYVHDLLDEAGYDVEYEEFEYQIADTLFQQISPDATTYREIADFYTAAGTAYGDATGVVVPVDVNNNPGSTPNSNTSGCEASDFASFPQGAVALLQRGTCSFLIKAENASRAGASAAIIYNEGTEGQPDRIGPINPTVEGGAVTIPVVGVPYELGRDLMDPAGTTVRINPKVVDYTTRNVIAETPGGNADNIVMLGGHLDSDTPGPGINDNGTGTAALLETALQMDLDVNNKVRFAFWSAEESGLIGSDYYVSQLTEAEIEDIALYLNFDMVGSPNYFRGVYDGSGTLGGTAPRPEGSEAIENMFNTHFGFAGLPFEDTEFSGRSDYQAFIENGIPSGGLFTGAEVPKTQAQVERYGGVAGAAFDPCYHQRCDSFTPLADGGDPATYAALAAAYGDQLVGNVNTYALDTSADAIAHAAATYAYSTASVNGVE
jgi:Zn-dependent M28 family amino/carboxypeptidase